jgi:hypothetical protein
MTISAARAPSLPNNPAAIVCRDPKTRHTTQHLKNVRARMIKAPVEVHGGRSCFEREICTPASAVTSLIPASTALPHTLHSQGSKACLMGKNLKDKQAPVPLGPLHPDRGSFPNGGRNVSPIGDDQDVALIHMSSQERNA